MAVALAALDGRSPFADAAARLHGVAAELADVAADVRHRGEVIEGDPERQAEVGARRQLLQELRRKYGETLAEVIEWRDAAEQRLAELEGHEVVAAALDAERVGRPGRAGRASRARSPPPGAAAAGPLAEAVEAQLPDLAMPKARLEVDVAGAAGHDVVFRFAANPGMGLQPLAKVASGGELARAMLALRLVLTEGPPVLVFDEVDAGIGGAAALAVGRSLAALADDHQVLVVTHLAQVAAWADAHVVVDKQVEGDTTAHHASAASTATSARPSWPGCCRAPPTRPPPATTPASCSTPPPPPRSPLREHGRRTSDATVPCHAAWSAAGSPARG